MSRENIPAELRDRHQWVAWKAAIVSSKDGPRTTKHPYRSARDKADSTDPTTWLSFEQACALVDHDGMDGIGFVFCDDDPYVGIDLDKCFDSDSGEIEPWAASVIENLDSYTELSPSGRGFHIIVRGRLPPEGRRKGRLEMYETGRYFTMTGNRWPDSPADIVNRQEALLTLHARVFAEQHAERPPARSAPSSTAATNLDDNALIDHAMRAKNGSAFQRLWEGDHGDYPSQSEADAALCALLAFWTGRDAGRMDRLFRQSGLYRKKWDQKRGAKTYGQRTIDRAVERCREIYTPYTLPTPRQADGDSAPVSSSPRSASERARSTAPSIPVGVLDRAAYQQKIDQSDDFDALTATLASEIYHSNLPRPAKSKLLRQIAKKTGVTQADLVADFKRESIPPPPPQQVTQSLVDELNGRHAVVPVGGRVRVMNIDYDPIFQRRVITFSAREDFLLRYCNRDAGPTDLGAYWLESPDRRQFEGLVFAPGRDVPGYYNLFQGFGVQPAQGSCGKFIDFLQEVICAGNDAAFDYLWCWLAHLFQCPDELPGVAIVLRSGQGTGKNTFVDTLAGLVGHAHFIAPTNMHHITGKFSAHLANVLLVFANEAIWGGDKTAEGALKAMITDTHVIMEGKGENAISVPNFKRLIVASNEDWAVPRGMDDRRFLVLDISEKHKEDLDYFTAIRVELANGGLAALMYALLQVDLSDWRPNRIPDLLREGGWDLKIRSGSSVLQWWYECLEIGCVFVEHSVHTWPNQIGKQELRNHYLRWCTDHKVVKPAQLIQIGKELFSFGVEQIRPRSGDGLRVPMYKIPELPIARERFCSSLSIPKGVFNDD